MAPKQKFTLGDLGAVPVSHIPNTLEDAEAKGTFARAGPSTDRGDRYNRQRNEERNDAELTFTRAGPSSDRTRGGDREREPARDLTFSRAPAPRPDEELTFTRGNKAPAQTSHTTGELTFSRQAASKPAEELTFSRGRRAAAEEKPAEPSLFSRVKKDDGLTFLQRKKLEREKQEKAEQERLEKERLEKERLEKERLEKERIRLQKEEEERAAREAAEKAFLKPEFHSSEVEKFALEVSNAFDAKDFSGIRVISEGSNHNIYNAIGTYLVPFIIYAFRFGFKQDGKMSTEDFKSICTEGLAAMSSLTERCQLSKEIVSKRVLWEVATMNRVFNGACLNPECHIADALLQVFLDSVISKEVSAKWLSMAYNNDAETPEDARDLWRSTQKFIRQFSKMVE